MPTIRTVISDLYHDRVRGVGTGFGLLAQRTEREFGTLSDAEHVTQKASPAKFSFGMKDFKMVIDCEAADYPAANGSGLFFEDAWSTVATITRARRIVGGGGYSGCLYSVYRDGNGDYKCVHTARPNGSDVYVNQLQNYAAAQLWVLIHAIPTRGLVQVGGCTTVFCMTRVSYTVNPILVRSVRLALDRDGFSVRRHRSVTQG